MSVCLVMSIWDGVGRCVGCGRWTGSEWRALHACSPRLTACTGQCALSERHVWEIARMYGVVNSVLAEGISAARHEVLEPPCLCLQMYGVDRHVENVGVCGNG